MNETEPPEWEKLEGWDRTFAHMWEIAFRPELERRRTNGLIPDGFQLYMAQLLQPPEGTNKVLFNEEVMGMAYIRLDRNAKKGDEVYISDLSLVEKFDLPDDLLDCGHFTIIRSNIGWRIFFNFLSGRAKARDMLDLADQYLQASIASESKEHAGPAVDNLFSACELISKAELIIHRIPAAQAKTHKPISSGINAWARLGNIDQAFVNLFNKLGEQRPKARYGDKDHRPPPPGRENFELVRAMIDRGLERVSPAKDRKSNTPER